MHRHGPVVLMLALSTHALPSAVAQCQPEWDPRFAYPGTASPTTTLTTFDDGSGPALFVGGTFGMAGGIPAGSIARWNGVHWSDLQGGANGFVATTIEFDDGSGPALYAGGSFTSIGGVSASRIARWNGTSWSALSGGVAGDVAALASFDAGGGAELYAAVRMSAMPAVSSVLRWDGASWNSVGGTFDGRIEALATFDDGGGSKLYAGGLFSTAGGASADNIANWNGASWTAVGSGTDDEVTALREFDDGNGLALYAGGLFDFAGGVAASPIARWNGTNWSAVGNAIDGGFSTVLAITAFDGGGGSELIVGGSLGIFGGVPVNGVARWDGTSWSSLASGIDGLVAGLGVFDDGAGDALYAVGEFAHAGGVFADRIARWDGSAWSALGLGTNGQLQALATCDVGGSEGLFAAGNFDSAGSTLVESIARWDGSIWSPLGLGFSFGGVKTLCSFDDGSGTALYAGGEFMSAGGVAAGGIARWNGLSWSAVGGGVAGSASTIEALVPFDDGSGSALYAAGSFTTAGGTPANSIARWNGSSWSALGAGITGGFARVEALAVFDDGPGGSGPALFAAGSFTAAGGIPTAGIAKWNGASWSSMPGITIGFSTLATFDAGTGMALYVGGIFTSIGGVPAQNVARWNGASWSALGAGTDGAVESLIVFDDGSGSALYAGGGFTHAGGIEARRAARWNGSSWSALGTGLGGLQPNGVSVRALAVFEDGTDGTPDLYLGGTFKNAGGFGASGIAQWHGCASPFVALCFGDGTQTTACPCANVGLIGHGCDNSAATGGSLLVASGSVQSDTVVLSVSAELPNALSIFLQGNAELATPVAFGDGVRCVGGSLKRLYVKNAVAGATSAPGPSDPSITARSASLGDPIAPGSTRSYQVYYRDPVLAFCPAPTGNSWNVSNGIRISW